MIEPGWECTGAVPDICTEKCGDGLRVGSEVCDDGLIDINGCTTDCLGVVDGWTCEGGSSVSADNCWETCGDGFVTSSE